MAMNMLAIDIGNSHGRVMIGKFDGTRIQLEEVHTFLNGGERVNNNFYWDILRLFAEIKTGIKKAVQSTDNKITSIGIDTWGLDYGLLDRQKNLIGFPYNYRDNRTRNLYNKIFKIISKKEIYRQTGIQFMEINTLVQLYADLCYRPWIMENAQYFLMIPDLLNFFLSGEIYNEYTNASTTQLFNPVEDKWARQVMAKLGIPSDLFGKIIYPGTYYGDLKTDLKDECGLKGNLQVISVGSHDTASAIAAAPLKNENDIFISSGTWSLVGMELNHPIITDQAREDNFTNELGVERKIRFLKNLTGLWLVQECKRSWVSKGLNIDYDQIYNAAEKAASGKFIINPDDSCFLNPLDMPTEIRNYCQKTGQSVPAEPGEMARGIYESLAFSYNKIIKKLESLTGNNAEKICIVGGGAKIKLLSKLTATISGKDVIVGPIEATIMGNCLTQLLAAKEINSLEEGRKIVKRSTNIAVFHP
jgi:rhamnulokinase